MMGEVSRQVVLDPSSRISDYIPTYTFPLPLIYYPSLGLPRWLSSKESTCQTGDMVFTPGSVRAPGGGNGNPHRYSIHSNILAWEIPLTEEPGGLESMGLQRLVHNLVTKPQHLGTEGVGGWELNRVTECVHFMCNMCVCMYVCVGFASEWYENTERMDTWLIQNIFHLSVALRSNAYFTWTLVISYLQVEFYVFKEPSFSGTVSQ